MKGKPVSDAQLGAWTELELQQSNNWAGSQWREAIKQGLNYFLLDPKGDEVPGRSQAQSGDVADMIDHIQAELQPMYGTEDLIRIGQEGPQDESFEIEEQALNWYWQERSRGFNTTDTAVQDGLLSRVGYIKVWLERSYGRPYEETLTGEKIQIDAQLAQLQQEAQVTIQSQQVVQEEFVEVRQALSPEGLPVTLESVVSPALFEVEVLVIPIHTEVKLGAPAPEDMFVSKDASDLDMQKPRFVAERRTMTRYDAIGLGLDEDEVQAIPTISLYDGDVRTYRKEDYDTYARTAPSKDGNLIDLYEVYYLLDRDGDGIAELNKFFYSTNKRVLHWKNGESTCELVRSRPYAAGSPLKVGHRHQGRSIWDKEYQVEDIKRMLIRQMLDNMALANDSEAVVHPDVQQADLEQTDVGRYIRATDPSQYMPVPHPDITGNSLAALGYMDKMRKERAGAAIEMSTQTVPGNQAAFTTDRIMTSMEKLVSMYARNFAKSLIRDAAVLMHQQLSLLPGALEFNDGQDWQRTEPRYWIQRNRISVQLGLSEGEKLRQLGALREIITLQAQDKENEGILFTKQSMYQARKDATALVGLPDPSQYWLNPESPEAQRTMAARQQAQQMQQQMMMYQQKQMLDAQLAMTQMQEMTKRMGDQMDQVQATADRFAKLLIEMSKLEAQTGKDIPFGIVEGSEETPIQ